MRLLITGGNGFIGKALIEKASKNHEILSLVRKKNKKFLHLNVKEIEIDLKNIHLIESDILKFKADCCIHLAWDGLPNYSLVNCISNINITTGLLELVVRAKIPRVFIAGTCWEYGSNNGPQDEKNTPELSSIFALTKRFIFSILTTLAKENNFEYRWGRIFFAYGPGQRKTSLLPSLIEQHKRKEMLKVNEPNAIQDFIHIDDLTTGIEILSTIDLPNGAYNLGSGNPTSVSKFANITAENLNLKIPYCEEITAISKGMWANMNLIYSRTGWKPIMSINEGISKTLNFYKYSI